MQRRSLLLSLLLAFVVAVGCSEAPAPNSEPPTDAAPIKLEDGFTWLDRKEFEAFPAETAANWTGEGHVIRCDGNSRGYLHTQEAFGDFTLRGEFRFGGESFAEDNPPNTGFLIFTQEPHRVWPDCLEVQGRWDSLFTIKSNAPSVSVEVTDDADARASAATSPGEWQRFEIRSDGGRLTSVLNGTVIATSEPTELREGMIGLQSEGFPVVFRNLRIAQSSAD